MAVDWEKVLSNAIQEALKKLNSNLPMLVQATQSQVTAMVANGRYIEENKDRMTKDEYDMIVRIQNRASEGVFLAFEGIGIVAAQQAAEAAWDVVATAIKSAAGVAFI